MGIDTQLLEGLRGLVIFDIAEQEFCSDINNVLAIIRINEAKFWNVERFLTDIEFNKVVFRVVDIHGIYGFNPVRITDSTRIMLFELFGKKFCFIVDRVIEMLTTDRIFIEKSLDIVQDTDKGHSRGILKYQKRNIFIPNFEKICKDLNSIAGLVMPPVLEKELFHRKSMRSL